MTPEQKWRAEAIAWLESIGVKSLQEKTNKELHKIIQEESNYLSYLMIEYIVNVKPQKETPQHIAEIKSQKQLS